MFAELAALAELEKAMHATLRKARVESMPGDAS
jgi:hypothetical protein